MLRDGAIPIFSFEDVLTEYYSLFGNIIDAEKASEFNLSKLYSSIYSQNTKNIVIEEKVKSIDFEKNSKNINLTLSKNAKIVYNYLDKDFFTIDDLLGTNLNVNDIFTAVTELELNGVVKAVPGGRYTKV